MVDATQTRFVHMTQQRMQSGVLARLAIQTLEQVLTPSARVSLSCPQSTCTPYSAFVLSIAFPDSCQVNNCGCDLNAACSHQATTNACECKCKTGYTNIGCPCNPFCTGMGLDPQHTHRIQFESFPMPSLFR